MTASPPMIAERGFGRMAPVALAVYVVALVFLAARSLTPESFGSMPDWIAWFGSPGSFSTIVITLGLPLAYLVFRRFTGRPNPGSLVLIGAMAASAIFLAVTAYWNCHGTQSVLFAPLAWTLALFAGNVENPFDPAGPATCAQMPVALELARLLAIATTLTTAVAAALTLSRSQIDRIAIWRARKLVAVVGIDAESVPLLQSIARNMSPNETLAVLTSNSDPEIITAIREAGAKIRTVDLDDDDALGGLAFWGRLERLYLLSNDPARNVARHAVIDRRVGTVRPNRWRLPLTVRIDDPWQAEVWRRNFLATPDRRWVADAIGRYEMTAAKLIRHIAGNDGAAPTRTLLICGMSPLTPALTSELAQQQREYEIYPRPGTELPQSAVIMSRGATSFIEDHELRQQRMAGGGDAVAIRPADCEPTIEAICDYLNGVDPESVAVILCTSDTDSQTTGTRLALRFRGLKIYQHSESATSLTSTSVIGHLYTFPIAMDLDPNAPQDAWERAAEMIHESYSQTSPRDTPATLEWKDLDQFWKGSNRRLVINTLWMVEKDTDLTWDSLESPPVTQLPEGFSELGPEEQLAALGLDASAIEHMIATEHADWCRYYQAHGWNYCAKRDDNRREHPLLREWRVLMAEEDASAHRRKAMKTLAGTLITLRNLGYRAVPQTHRALTGADS